LYEEDGIPKTATLSVDDLGGNEGINLFPTVCDEQLETMNLVSNFSSDGRRVDTAVCFQ
jgi:hypothetical protein